MAIGFDSALEHTGQVVLATGALGTAAAALVDASRGVFTFGGVSSFGYRHLKAVYTALSPALKIALGAKWEAVLRGYWVNGAPRDQQISTVIALVRLGLTADNPQRILDNLLGDGTENGTFKAVQANVQLLDTADLARAVGFLKGPVTPEAETMTATSEEAAVSREAAYADEVESQKAFDALGRFDALVRVRLEAAFDLADHEYRGRTRLTAAVTSVGLSLVCAGTYALAAKDALWGQHMALAVILGLLAVPLAPIAKDITSALKAASGALQAATSKA
ncbi:MAG: hypothetical protein QM667_03205 [Asticcacaulis sp.]